MGYYLNSILIKNESNFEKIEQLYHTMAYPEYEAIKRKKSGEIYTTINIKYFSLPKDSCFCIYDSENVEIPDIAENLSRNINNTIITIQIFDSDELEIQAFNNGKKIAYIYKNHKKYKTDGDLNCISADKEKCISILKDDYVFMEDCAEKLFPEQIIFPEEKIEGQKVIKYHKEIQLELETEKLPEFSNQGCVPPMPDSKDFCYFLISRGKKSKGLIVLLKGSAINYKNITISKGYINTGLYKNPKNQIQCSDPEIKNENGETYLIYRFNDFEIPAGYKEEVLNTLFSSSNMSLYQMAQEYKLKSAITITFDCKVSKLEGTIEAMTFPNENLENGSIYTEIELEDRLESWKKYTNNSSDNSAESQEKK
ncbi:hypothetical protein [Treponema sp.]|uniref:hypothetical protein n=1 Tax=Treponema sp. TaxID=166 RepID=UPI00298E4925|nr:hypothetical protein [Treponema sp.]MCR5613293.1 hypothetical protein [Treponema sp.]